MLLRSKRRICDVYDEESSRKSQSLRGIHTHETKNLLDIQELHKRCCFSKMLENEIAFADDFAVFYHIYGPSALIYEVQAAMGYLWKGFNSEMGSLPRLDPVPFQKVPTVSDLRKLWKKTKNTKHDLSWIDHAPEYRSVGIAANISLLATDTEASPLSHFTYGHGSVFDMNYRNVLEQLLRRAGIRKQQIASTLNLLVEAGQKHGLDVNGFQTLKQQQHSRINTGHCLQIFLRRELVDKYVYASTAGGTPIRKRLSSALKPKKTAAQRPLSGQVRICFNPAIFMNSDDAHLILFSSNPAYHNGGRQKLQKALCNILSPIISKSPKN